MQKLKEVQQRQSALLLTNSIGIDLLQDPKTATIHANLYFFSGIL